VVPNKSNDDTSQAAVKENEAPVPTTSSRSMDPEQSLEALREYKEAIANKLKDIDDKLEGL